jgi:hypothetical protein
MIAQIQITKLPQSVRAPTSQDFCEFAPNEAMRIPRQHLNMAAQ